MEKEKENILKYSLEGKNKYYYLNEFNPHIKEIIKLNGINLIEIKQSIVGLKKEFDDLEDFLDFLADVIDLKNQDISKLKDSLDHISGKTHHPAGLDS